MAKSIIMPRQGQSVESCIITKLFIEEGSRLNVGDLLFAYETDKASFEEEAEEDGVLLKWMFDEGDEVPVLETVCYIGDKDEKVEKVDKVDKVEKVEKVEKIEKVDKVEKLEKVEGKLKISPRALKLAAEKGINPADIQGTGPGGRIIASDIENYDLLSDGPPSNEEYTLEPLTNMRKIIAKAMHNSLRNAAQLTHHLGADARKMLSYREEVKSRQGKSDHVNITINDMVCMAVIEVLKEYPRLNAHLHGDEMRLFKSINLGLAVDTDRGLMVPSLISADTLTLREFANASADLAIKCRKGSVNPDILAPENASFTISNLGSYGVEMFTPVINLPQVAILGVNAITLRPVDAGNGTVDFLPYIGLSLTYDHRALDGGEATRFLKDVALKIENLELELQK
ncbi:MAG: dihydrolipoamide acetyltransferase family protein [Bacteroidales bacterium]|nr:dihydrolipoamide acetyltransferase family protein [Bacteroidales bacterium]